MKRWKNLIWWGGLSVVASTVAVLILGGLRSNAVGETTKAPSTGKLIVHEWGTFTSFSGSNGAQLDFRPLLAEDLPSFVSTRERQSGAILLTKGRIRARIRMETPVTYFYTDVERTVRASVQFPKGLLTEFYPPVVEMAPKYNQYRSGEEPFGNSMLDWGEIRLIPTAKLASGIEDDRTRAWLQHEFEQKVLPTDGYPSNHYYHARNTDSALVHIHRPADAEKSQPASNFLEKFLFYRGLGRFDQPLQVNVGEGGRVTLKNAGQHPIRSLFRVTVADKKISYSEMDALAAGASAEFPTTSKSIELTELQERIVQALVAEQLYPREATAMVNTWADSWFAEEGTRIFYMVPRETTDKVLPLTISPAPDETVRVLVGRVEVLEPSVERELMEVVKTNITTRAKWLKDHQDVDARQIPPLPIPPEFVKLGRLAEPALARIREIAKDDAVSQEASYLLRECQDAVNKQAE